MRAGTLLTWYYLLGNYDNPQESRNWTKSLYYLKEMIERAEKKQNKEMTRGGTHNSLLLFLLQQEALIKDFNYFKNDAPFFEKVSSAEFIKKLIKEVVHDSVSQTNKALVINSFYLCQKFKKMLFEQNVDVNKLWRSARGGNITIENTTLKKMMLGQIPFIDQCELWRCTEHLQEIAYQESLNAIDFMQVELGTFLDLFNGPDDIDNKYGNYEDIEGEVQETIKGDTQALEEV